MQLSSLTLRIGGSLLHTVHKADCTPAEIMVLQRIHGQDAVADVRPTKIDKSIRHNAEYERLAALYDRSGSVDTPDGPSASILQQMFPGAIKKLPTTLKEIGMGQYATAASIAAVDAAAAQIVPEPPEPGARPATARTASEPDAGTDIFDADAAEDADTGE